MVLPTSRASDPRREDLAVALGTLALRLEETVIYVERSISHVLGAPVRKVKESSW